MTLRLRRGNDLERQSITFQEGELVYITDTKDLYAGDGTTVGGIKVSNIGSPSSLTQNLNLNGYNIQGSGTISATEFVGDGSALTGIDIGVQSGQEYDIDIRGRVRGFDSTVIIDPITNNIYGNFFGDGSNLSNVPGTIVSSGDYTINIAGYVKTFTDEVMIDPSTKTLFGDFIGSHQGSLRADDSTLLVDADTGSFFGTFVGDGSLISNITIDQLDDVDIINPSAGEVLIFDGFSWTNSLVSFPEIVEGSNYKINIVGADSTIIVDSSTGTITANNNIQYDDTLNFVSLIDGVISNINFSNSNEAQYIRLIRSDDGPELEKNIGLIAFDQVYDDSVSTNHATISAWNTGMYFSHSTTGSYDSTKFVSIIDGNVAIGGYYPTAKLDVQGDAVITGGLTADLIGSVFADNSTLLVDAVNGVIPGYISIALLQSVASSSADFASFKIAIAAL